jgi:hypothetical protein
VGSKHRNKLCVETIAERDLNLPEVSYVVKDFGSSFAVSSGMLVGSGKERVDASR